jgi:protein-L-isoaspartate(D-aspartate) O-methyltransferase
MRRSSYDDSALPIGHEQTISQPWVVAAICQALALEGDEMVLEIGTGSGYSTAILALLAGDVLSIERFEGLAAEARARIEALEPGEVEIRVGDGTRGAPDRAPFEAIAVHATAPAPPPTLLAQLAPGGRMVIPLAQPGNDALTLLRKGEDSLEASVIAPARFVPLVGEEGFSDRGA